MKKKLTSQTMIAIGFSSVAVVLFVGAFVYQNLAAPEAVDDAERQSITVRDDSRRLGAAGDGDVTVAQFVDFDCEACASAYPVVEQLRETYAGRVSFVVRYFPSPDRPNADSAAYAVEAAARQGRFEEMYRRMFDTQADWGRTRESKAAVFRTYAAELGLDLARYDADVASPEVAARVQKDVDDGTTLGVAGAPSYYLNGRRLIPSTTAEFVEAIDEALAQQ